MQAITYETNDLAGKQLTVHVCNRLSRYRPCAIALLSIFMLAALVKPLPASAALPTVTADVYMAPTGQPIQGGFLQTFQKYGVAMIGYPLTPEIKEGGTTVQYFERVKMEYHPELAANGTPVLLTRLGADISEGSPFSRVNPPAAGSYFDMTGHSLAEPFLSFWRNNGAVGLFGYPISEVIWQDGMQVQWFERARMEYHPELASKGYPVELTLLGLIAYNSSSVHTPPAGNPAPPLAALNNMEASFLAGINAQRSAAGLSPVSVTSELSSFARWRSTDMATRNYFSHTTPEGKSSLQLLSERGISYSLSGEILSKNNYSEADAVKMAMAGLMQSPPHRAIILDPRYTQVGVGYAQSADGIRYFTAVFIRK